MESMRTTLQISALLLLSAVLISSAAGQVTEPRRLMVGDDSGWRLGFNYTEWAAANPVQVTDILVFKYDNASHTLATFNTKEEFDTCNFTSPKSLRGSGFSNVVMAEVGPRFYACSIGMHCKNGMKLTVDVLPQA